MKNRLVYSGMILSGIVWLWLVSISFGLMNANSDTSLAAGLFTFFGAFILFPSIFSKLYTKLKKVSKEER